MRADAGHQSAGRGGNAAESEDSTDAARHHAVAHKLIELTPLEVFVLHDQALGGGLGVRERSSKEVYEVVLNDPKPSAPLDATI
jgi:hypothetical protein